VLLVVVGCCQGATLLGCQGHSNLLLLVASWQQVLPS
jgi:hypothetical protein